MGGEFPDGVVNVTALLELSPLAVLTINCARFTVTEPVMLSDPPSKTVPCVARAQAVGNAIDGQPMARRDGLR